MLKNIWGTKFVWDDNKNEINKSKHGISFETATLVFRDPMVLIIYDENHSQDEDRYIAIGRIGGVVVVVHREQGDSIRIISARVATKKEEEAYYGR